MSSKYDQMKIWFLYEENKEIKREPLEDEEKVKLTWRSFLGSMSDIDRIYEKENFLKKLSILKFCFILIDSILRGIGQVMFANSPLSGFIMTIGLFIGDWQLAFYGLLGTTISTLTAHLLQFDRNLIRAGLYGYNGCLSSMAIAYFTFPGSPQIIPFVIIMSMFSTIFYQSLRKIFVDRLGIPPFTLSFQVSSWIWLLGALKYRYYYLNGNLINPKIFVTSLDKPNLFNETYSSYTAKDNFLGFFCGISQVFFISNPYTGAIILVGIAVCSRILSFFALFGSVTGQLTAAYFLGVSSNSIADGLWGFNTVLTCQALGGMFLILNGYQIWILVTYCSIATILVQGALSSFLSSCGMPTFTFPFSFICWIVCLIVPTNNLIGVKLSDCNIPEDHSYRFSLSKLIKKEYKYLNKLTKLRSSVNEDITNVQLKQIVNDFVPNLMLTYVYRNQSKKLKYLYSKVKQRDFIDFNNRNLLHISCSQGFYQISKWIIEKTKTDVNLIDNFGSTPLFDAFINGNCHLLNYLRYNGATYPINKMKELAFYLNGFVYEKNFEGIQHLISSGFDPNETDYDGRSCLHLAVNTNQFDLVQFFVEHTNISISIKDSLNKTPIDYSKENQQIEIENYFNEKRNRTNRKYVSSNQPVSMKSSECSFNLEENLLPHLLLSSDLNQIQNFLHENFQNDIYSLTDYDNRCLTHLAAIHNRLDLIKYFHEMKSIKDFEKILMKQDRWGLTTFDYALIHKHQSIISFLNEHCQFNQQEIHFPISNSLEKWKQIHLFLNLSINGDAQRIEYLYRRKYFRVDEIYHDYDGRTPMHLAVSYQQINVIELLFQIKYPGIDFRDRWGFSPLDIAIQNQFHRIISLFQ